MAREVPAVEREPLRGRAGRYTHRARLHAALALLLLALVLIVILIVQNTRHVKVGWVFGYSRISLVYLVLFSTILGWLLGLATSMLIRRRTRRPLTARRVLPTGDATAVDR